MLTYSVFEARDSLSRVISEAQSGQEVIITKRGKPVVTLQPVQVEEGPISGRQSVERILSQPLPGRDSSTEMLDQRVADARDAWQ